MNANQTKPSEHREPLVWLESTGGPLLLLEKELLTYWHGAFGNSATTNDYDRACEITDYVGVVQVGPGFGVVLGEEPFSTTWWQSEGLLSSFLVRWVYAEDEAQVHDALSSIRVANHWEATDVAIEVVTSRLVLFDSSCPGIDTGSHLTLEIPPGRYSIETLHYNSNDETSLILHRFVPQPIAQMGHNRSSSVKPG